MNQKQEDNRVKEQKVGNGEHPNIFSTLLPIAIQLRIWMWRQNGHTTQRNFVLCICTIIIYLGLLFQVRVFLNSFVKLTSVFSISSFSSNKSRLELPKYFRL